jgi:hypothetical protein
MPLRRAAPLLLALLAGCAGAPTEEERPEPVRFAVITAPALGGDAPGAEWTGEDLLLEAVTRLSGEPGLDFVVVAGPLFAAPSAEARDVLVGALGSIAPPVLVALAPGDLDAPDLLEALEALAGHGGKAAYTRTPRPEVRVSALGPDGAPPPQGASAEPAEGARRALAVLAAGAGVPLAPEALAATALLITPGAAPALAAVPGGPLRLELPSLREAPHLFARVEVSPAGAVSVALRAVTDAPAPAPPAPAALPR